MKRTEYLCDICHDVVRTNEGETLHEFVPFEFDRTKRPYTFIETVNFWESERHICHDCLRALRIVIEKR